MERAVASERKAWQADEVLACTCYVDNAKSTHLRLNLPRIAGRAIFSDLLGVIVPTDASDNA